MLYNDTRVTKIDLSIYKNKTRNMTHSQYKSIPIKAQDIFYIITDVENLAYLGNFKIDLTIPSLKIRQISDNNLNIHLENTLRSFVMGNASLHNVIIGIISLYTDINNIAFNDMLCLLRNPLNDKRHSDISDQTKKMLFIVMQQDNKNKYYEFYNTIYNEFVISNFLYDEIKLFKDSKPFDVTDHFNLLQFRINHLLENIIQS